MNLPIFLIFSIGPAVLLLYYFYKKDAHKPEPVKAIIKVFVLGILTIILAVILGEALEKVSFPVIGKGEKEYQQIEKYHAKQSAENSDNDFANANSSRHPKPLVTEQFWIYIFFTSFITAGFLEELSKLLIFLLVVWRMSEFDEVMDGIVYTITISLSFAAVENIFYGIEGGLFVLFIRAFTAVPSHALCSGIMGYFLGLAKHKPQQSFALIVTGLLLAVFFHGVYDVFAFGSIEHTEFAAGILIIIVTEALILRALIKKALLLDKTEGRV